MFFLCFFVFFLFFFCFFFVFFLFFFCFFLVFGFASCFYLVFFWFFSGFFLVFCFVFFHKINYLLISSDCPSFGLLNVSFETWSQFWPRPSRSQLVSARKLCSGDALRPDLPWVLNYTVLSVPSKGHLQFTGLQGAERGPQCALLGPLQFAGLHFCTEKHTDQCNMP